MMARETARQMKEKGKGSIVFIGSNCVLPGMIKTSRWEQNLNNAKYCMANYTPKEDIADFEDIANAAWYFGSENSKNTTGGRAYS